MRRIEETETPTAGDAQQVEFLRFFEDKVQKIRKDTSTSPESTFDQHSGDKFSEVTLTNCDTILKLIKDAPNTHCALHPAPTWLVKSCAHCLAPFICLVVNRSLSDCYLPASQKLAFVTSILKKRGLDKCVLKNHRPVSNLTFLSKLLE